MGGPLPKLIWMTWLCTVEARLHTQDFIYHYYFLAGKALWRGKQYFGHNINL
jgi:hypothetical protein